MDLWPRMQDLWGRLGAYPPLPVVIELAIIWIVVWLVVRFVQGTRAAGAIKGVLFLLLVGTLAVQIFGGSQTLPRLAYLYDRLLAVVAIGLVVIFQPELRRALIRIGEANPFGSRSGAIADVVQPVVGASSYLAKARFGAIIVIQRQIGLEGLVEGGTVLDAKLSEAVIQTIFFPGTALHDLAVIVKGKVVHAAGVQLPMAEPSDMPDPSMGARHRAAVGLTKECDALVIVVSEETGHIRIAERGRLTEPLGPDGLRTALTARLGSVPEAKTAGETAEESDLIDDEPNSGRREEPAA